MEGLKVYMPAQRGRQDSFWYAGVCASFGEVEMMASGEITIRTHEHPNNAVSWDDIAREAKTDRGLRRLVGEEGGGAKYYWAESNWFEVYLVADLGDAPGIYDTYDEAFEAMVVAGICYNKVAVPDL